MIRIAFRYDDPRLFSRLVSWWQHHDSAHCEASGGWHGMTHECISSSFLDHGVRAKLINLEPGKWRIYELPGDPQRVSKWFLQHAGQGYDVPGILGFVWRRVKGWMNLWFCSEACADILGLPEPWRFDVASLEAICARFGTRVQ